MQPQQHLFKSLFSRDIGDSGTPDYLRDLVARHPYFSPAQFYLLRLSEPGTALYEKQAGITNLFFSNPLWLNLQLLETRQPTSIPEKTESNADISAAAGTVPVAERIVAESEPLQVHAEPVALQEEPGQILLEETIAEPVAELPAIETLAAELEPVTQTMAEPATGPVAEAITPEPVAMHQPDTPPTEETKLPEELPLFEPMHMVDYFASQGIKLSEEMQTADKLGKQLKSFTEWLKTMKKVHTGSEQTTGSPDKTVEDLAEKSNVGNEVITEAMAEVFARQGKRAKAVEVYQKLSLLNPAKSAYFAAKIEHLKDA